MSNKAIKYIALSTLGILIIWIIIPFGDYTTGLSTILILMLLFALSLFLFLLITITSFIKFYRIRQKFDFIPLYITSVFSLLIVYVFNADNKKFWTKEIVVANIDNLNSNGGSLTLYKNNSFTVIRSYTDYSESYQGNYTIKNDTLFLDRKNLSFITDSIFTTTYIWNVNNKSLMPVNKKFNSLKVIEKHIR